MPIFPGLAYQVPYDKFAQYGDKKIAYLEKLDQENKLRQKQAMEGLDIDLSKLSPNGQNYAKQLISDTKKEYYDLLDQAGGLHTNILSDPDLREKFMSLKTNLKNDQNILASQDMKDFYGKWETEMMKNPGLKNQYDPQAIQAIEAAYYGQPINGKRIFTAKGLLGTDLYPNQQFDWSKMVNEIAPVRDMTIQDADGHIKQVKQTDASAGAQKALREIYSDRGKLEAWKTSIQPLVEGAIDNKEDVLAYDNEAYTNWLRSVSGYLIKQHGLPQVAEGADVTEQDVLNHLSSIDREQAYNSAYGQWEISHLAGMVKDDQTVKDYTMVGKAQADAAAYKEKLTNQEKEKLTLSNLIVGDLNQQKIMANEWDTNRGAMAIHQPPKLLPIGLPVDPDDPDSVKEAKPFNMRYDNYNLSTAQWNELGAVIKQNRNLAESANFISIRKNGNMLSPKDGEDMEFLATGMKKVTAYNGFTNADYRDAPPKQLYNGTNMPMNKFIDQKSKEGAITGPTIIFGKNSRLGDKTDKVAQSALAKIWDYSGNTWKNTQAVFTAEEWEVLNDSQAWVADKVSNGVYEKYSFGQFLQQRGAIGMFPAIEYSVYDKAVVEGLGWRRQSLQEFEGKELEREVKQLQEDWKSNQLDQGYVLLSGRDPLSIGANKPANYQTQAKYDETKGPAGWVPNYDYGNINF